MPRLHFPDQSLVLRLVEAAVTSGAPLMLAHDHGLYLCTDAMREPDGTCVCVYAKGCDPRQNAAAFDVANYLVGHDDFGISFPMGGQEQLLADLKRGHRLAIEFGRRAVAIVMKAPPTKQSQTTRAARGRGNESHPTARNKDSTMTTTATKKKMTTKAAPKKSGERLKNEARAEIAKRIATLDAGGDPSAEATVTGGTEATSANTAAPVAKGKASTKPKATKAKSATVAKPAKPAKAAKSKRLSALDAAAQVCSGPGVLDKRIGVLG